MAKAPKPMNFGIGGEVPQHAVGDILAAYVNAGVKWEGMQCVPIIPPPQLESVAELNGTKLLALPPPSDIKKGTTSYWVQKFLTKAGEAGLVRPKLVTKVQKKIAGLTATAVDQAAAKLVVKNIVVRVGPGHYKINPQAIQVEPKPRAKTKKTENGKGRGKSIKRPEGNRAADIIMRAMTMAHPDKVDRQSLKAALQGNGFNPVTVDGTVAKLVDAKKVKRAGEGKYALTKAQIKLLPQQQPTAAAEAH